MICRLRKSSLYLHIHTPSSYEPNILKLKTTDKRTKTHIYILWRITSDSVLYSIRLAYRRQIPVLTYLLKSSEQDLVLTVPLPNAQQQVWTSWVLCFLFVCGFTSYSRIFHSYGGVTITGEGLHILTYTRHSWPLSSVGSLACHTYSDTRHPFTMVISEYPWHSHLLPSVWLWNCHYLISRLKRRSWDSNTQPSACVAIVLTDYATAAAMNALNETIKVCTRPTVSVASYHIILTAQWPQSPSKGQNLRPPRGIGYV